MALLMLVGAIPGRGNVRIVGREYVKARRKTLLFAAAAALMCTVSPVEAAQAVDAGAVARGDNSDIPVYGQKIVPLTSSTEESPGMIVSVHGVYRTPSAAIIYYSVAGADPVGTRSISRLSNLWQIPRLSIFNDDLAVLVDPAGEKVYLALPQPDGRNPCICSNSAGATFMTQKGSSKAALLAMAIAPLPSEVKTVDVFVAGTVFHGVPVKDGLPQPQRENSNPVVLGEGWPRLDERMLKESDEKYKDRSVRAVTYPTVDASGVSQVPSGGFDRLAVPADVLFEFDKATLTPAATQSVASLVEQIKAKGTTAGEIRVVGHTDSQGSHDRNVELSKQRAETVAAELKKQLPGGITFVTEGRAETDPVASNDAPEGQAKNRRVELTLPKGK